MSDGFSIARLMTTRVISVSPETTLLDAGKKLATYKFNGLPVVDADNVLVGIVTEYDIIAHISGRTGKKNNAVTVGEIMTKNPYTLSQDATFEEALTLFRDHQTANPLPVIDKDRHVVGVVSRTDLLKGFEE
jgi:CBS domain-containing protein